MLNYFYIFGTIFFTTIGQIIMKYGSKTFGKAPNNLKEILTYLTTVATSVYFMSALFSALIAAFCWSIALNKFKLSFAYPFMSLSFVFVVMLSWILFGEQVSFLRWLGVFVICIGVFLISRS